MTDDTLAFAARFEPLIRSGRKDTTIRLVDDHNFASGDRIQLVTEAGDAIGMATVTAVATAPIATILDAVEAMGGSHTQDSPTALLDALEDHYPATDLGLDTEVTAIRFEPDEAVRDAALPISRRYDPRFSETQFERYDRLQTWGPSRRDWEQEEQYGP